jgi:N-acetyl-gamma-glutamyl-phosphate reductase
VNKHSAAQRRAEILKIVKAAPVHSQDELLDELKKAGYPSTQPTVSRDIRELGLIKTPTGYIVGSEPGAVTPVVPVIAFSTLETREERLRTQLAGMAVTVEQAGNLVIVRTPAAGANPVAHAIDAAAFPEALGTIAGDDTIFIAGPHSRVGSEAHPPPGRGLRPPPRDSRPQVETRGDQRAVAKQVIRVAVVGATGYSGAELCALLSRHSGVELTSVCSSEKGASLPFGDLHPQLSGVKGPAVRPLDLEALIAQKPDCVFLATPNEASAELAPRLVDAGCVVIDLAGSFRLRDAGAYPAWYGFEHPRPALLKEAVYGLTEHCGDELAKARLIANPGCYPTAALIALKPLAGLLEAGEPVIIDAMSGVSGAGKKSTYEYSFTELAGNVKAYSVGKHRHAPEIAQALGHPVEFVTHLIPVVRGILSTAHVRFAKPQTTATLAGLYEKAYAGAPLVRVRPAGELPELRHVVGTPRCEVGFQLLSEKRAVVVSVIDNLLKGAASQAVQNFNRRYGFAREEGLVWNS